ncbi:MAG: hypothetical protein GY858_05570 [Candidatus Omnitrophica bacterium]|nr:hypothetical protein [Candidatus Omnitrophota bacterium]
MLKKFPKKLSTETRLERIEERLAQVFTGTRKPLEVRLLRVEQKITRILEDNIRIRRIFAKRGIGITKLFNEIVAEESGEETKEINFNQKKGPKIGRPPKTKPIV